MKRWIPFPGTLLNTVMIVAGSLVGLTVDRWLPVGSQDIMISVMGLVTLALGLGMQLKGGNVLITVAALVVGGTLGIALGIDRSLETLAESLRQLLGGGGRFNEGFLTATILYCIGPMALMGCLEDALDGKSELLRVKAILDGVASVFLASALGVGVLASAASVLVIQGALTLAARPLRKVFQRESALTAAVATGGVLLMGIGFGLTGIKKFPTELFLPALVLAPWFAALADRWLPSVPGDRPPPAEA
jgi:hypothetical protein